MDSWRALSRRMNVAGWHSPPKYFSEAISALSYTRFIGAIVWFVRWCWRIARCSMGRVAPFGLLLPVFALISSVLFLGDRMTPKLIVGGLLAISGVAITQVRSPARPI